MVAGLVLAGGAGRRMGGRDKAVLVVGGVTLLDRVLDAARPVCDRLVVVGPVRPTGVEAVTFVQEAEAGGGPVPAVGAGLAVVPEADVVLVLAVDLPLLGPDDLRRLIAALAGAEAAAADDEGGPNPLLAAYAAPALRARASRLGAGARAAALLPPDVVTVDLGRATLNVNRPEDLAAAESAAAADPEGHASGGTLGAPGHLRSGGDVSADYPDRYAEALALELTDVEVEAVLELARVVAHGSERKFAPLSTYLAGQFVAELVRTGLTRSEAVAEALAVARRILDSEP